LRRAEQPRLGKRDDLDKDESWAVESESSSAAFDSEEVDLDEPERSLSLVRRQGNGCKAPTDKYNPLTVDGQYTFRRITVVKVHNVDRQAVMAIFANLQEQMVAAIRSRAGQANSNLAEYFSITGRNLGPYPNSYASAVAIPQTGTHGGNSGYRTWADVARYFNANVLENFVKRAIGDMAAGLYLAGVYELVDSGNNGVVRLLITNGMKGSGQPTKPN
jgi:hypothetical protein